MKFSILLMWILNGETLAIEQVNTAAECHRIKSQYEVLYEPYIGTDLKITCKAMLLGDGVMRKIVNIEDLENKI